MLFMDVSFATTCLPLVFSLRYLSGGRETVKLNLIFHAVISVYPGNCAG